MSFTSSPKMGQGTKLLIELGPLVAFFIANWKAGIFWGTGIFMVATAIALSVSWTLTRKIAMVPLVSAIFVALFGALTLWLHSDLFIKVKVTLINALFGAVLLGGVAMGRSYIKLIMGEAVRLTEAAWRTLSIRWGVFFFAMAGLNEIVWRSVSTDAWVNFKVFGLLPHHARLRACQCALHDEAHDRGRDARRRQRLSSPGLRIAQLSRRVREGREVSEALHAPVLLQRPRDRWKGDVPPRDLVPARQHHLEAFRPGRECLVLKMRQVHDLHLGDARDGVDGKQPVNHD